MRNALFILAAAFLGAMLSGWLNHPAPAWAQTADGGRGDAEGGVYVMGTGAGQQNQNDLCWVLARIQTAGEQNRTVLSLYRAKRGGDYFELEDVRMLDADLRVVELEAPKHERDKTVAAILKALPKEERDKINPPKPK